MRFETFQPCEALRNEIACFIISENDSEQPYIVLPDTALVMGFQYKGRLSSLINDEAHELATSGITGLQNGFRLFKNIHATGSILVRFKPGGASAFFRLPVHELFDQSLSLDGLISRRVVSIIEEQLQAACSDTARIRIIEAFLLSRRHSPNPDPLVMNAVALIQRAGGNIRIAQLARELYTSSSPLEKRFRSRIGATPKKYAAIIRFRNIISAGQAAKSPANGAFEAGYFDQAHFIKDFRRFTGTTPGQFFSAKNF